MKSQPGGIVLNLCWRACVWRAISPCWEFVVGYSSLILRRGRCLSGYPAGDRSGTQSTRRPLVRHPFRASCPESWLYQLTLQESFRVNSFHHQAVRRVGKGLRAVAWSQDGLIEALESEPEEGADGKPARIVAVQWHPECNWSREERSLALFKNLIAGVLTQKGS